MERRKPYWLEPSTSSQFLLVFLIILTFFYIIFQKFVAIVRVAVPLVTSVAVYRAIKAAETSNPKQLEKKTWRLVAVCLGIWLAGEISVLAFFIKYGVIPYPSFAEISYLLGYMLMTAGALLIIRKINVIVPVRHIVVFTCVILLMSMAVTNFVITKALLSNENPIEKTFHIALPLMDMMLIIVVFAIYFVYFGSGYRQEILEESWSIVILGMSFSALADVITTYNKVNLVSSIYLALLPGVLYIWSRGVLGIGAASK